jgi:hypothetical protein
MYSSSFNFTENIKIKTNANKNVSINSKSRMKKQINMISDKENRESALVPKKKILMTKNRIEKNRSMHNMNNYKRVQNGNL